MHLYFCVYKNIFFALIKVHYLNVTIQYMTLICVNFKYKKIYTQKYLIIPKKPIILIILLFVSLIEENSDYDL